MAKLAIKKASTDVTTYVFIQDSSKTTGEGLTGLAYNTASLVASYVRPLTARAALTLATQTVDGAHSDGGFVEVDATNMPGVYRLDLSDAICATGVNSVVVMLKGAANMAPVLLEIQLTDFDLNDASPNVTVADIANDAITAAAYDESTAFPIKKADATTTELARLDSASSYKADVSGLATPTNITAGTITTVGTTTNLTNLPTIPNDWITAAGLKTDAVTKIQNGLATPTNITAGTITTTTNLTNLPTMPAEWITASGLKADAVDEIADGVWDEAIAGHTTVTTFGGKNQKVVPSETINDYKADVSALALQASVDDLETRLTAVRAGYLDKLNVSGTLAHSNDADTYKADVSAITGAALSAAGIDAILDEVIIGTYTLRQLMRVIAAKMVGKATGGGTTSITYRGLDDTSDIIVETVDANGNRSAVTLTV